MSGRFLSVGECMVELSQAGSGLLRKSFAGDTFNTAWYARACLPTNWTVDFFTAVGDDAISDELIAFIEDASIGTGHVRRIQGRTLGLYLISLRHGERTFSYWRDPSAARQLAVDATRLRAAFEASDVIYFSGITLAVLTHDDVKTLLSELRRAKASGKLVVFDPNMRPRLWTSFDIMRATISEGACASTIVMPSFDDEAAHFGDASISATIDRYRLLGTKLVVVKNGPHGVTVSTDEGEELVPAEIVTSVVDTTSAGDSFNGAFLAAYLMDNNGIEAARVGARVAANVIGAHGALVTVANAAIIDRNLASGVKPITLPAGTWVGPAGS